MDDHVTFESFFPAERFLANFTDKGRRPVDLAVFAHVRGVGTGVVAFFTLDGLVTGVCANVDRCKGKWCLADDIQSSNGV